MIKKLPFSGLGFHYFLGYFVFLLSLNGNLSYAQEKEKPFTDYFFLSEILMGKTVPANLHFPHLNMQKGISIGFGKDYKNSKDEWAYRLNYPKTGIAFGVNDMGNSDVLGYQFSILPYAEFPLTHFKKKPLSLLVGLGSSYFTEKHNLETNPINKAVSTNLTWAFKLFTYYSLIQTPATNLRVGVGYSHQSNGHKKLPNNGYNSFLGSLNANFNFNENNKIAEKTASAPFSHSHNYYLTFESGWGQNTLSSSFNNPKSVYAFRMGVGKTINNTFRLGTGIYYHFYQHYQDYIQNNESLVQEGKEFKSLKENSLIAASAIGLFISGEITLLNHIGFFAQIGANLYKPAYGIDWRINEGWKDTPQEIPEGWVLGDYNSKYKIKKLFSTRLGAKYYFTAIDKNPQQNFFLSASINANLGQADFTEFGLGYIFTFKN